ncbi:MAG: SCO family protein [Myxococcota bacterium]
MGVLRAGQQLLLLLCLAFLQNAGCDRSTLYPARGVVQDVNAEYGQVVIAHEDIPGLMPAMTMNFDVPDEALLERLVPGSVIEFTVEFNGRSYRVTEASIKGEVEPGEGWVRFGDQLHRADPAPAFTLTDQRGERVALADLAGRALLLDFIYTTCPGPCPLLTASQVAVQRALSGALRERVWFVSISLDPANDTPEALAAYARDRGVDLSNWSFLTGSVEEVEAVLSAYGIGSSPSADGFIEHLVVRILIDGEGRIVKRYFGLEHESGALAEDLRKLAS